VLAHLRDEQPMSADELAEHERQWRAVEEELRAVEHADVQRDRRL
jgi:predicted transcriptional regulator